MIKTQKKQLSKNFLTVIASFLSLAASFVYALLWEPTFSYILAIGLFVYLLYLVLLQVNLAKRNAEIQLQIQDLTEKKNLIEDEIRTHVLAIDSFRKKIISYLELKGLTEKLSLCLYLEDTSRTISAEVNRLYGDEDSTIILYLFHSKTGELGISSSQKGQIQVNIKSKKGDIFDQWLVKAMQPLLVEESKSDYRFDIEKIKTEDARIIRSLISVPLLVGHKALGILRVDNAHEKHFTTEDLRFLTTIGDLGAVAIENAQLFEHIENLAIRDSLTDLYLRRYLLERLSEEINRHRSRKGELSFLMIDLDKFKQYNDKFGHRAGDIVLRTLAMLLKNYFKEPGMLLSRYGGEEFSVILPDCSKKMAVELAQGFRKRVEEQSIMLRRERTRITVSIGVATFPKDAHNKEELIQKADEALYQAKDKGRNQVYSI